MTNTETQAQTRQPSMSPARSFILTYTLDGEAIRVLVVAPFKRTALEIAFKRFGVQPDTCNELDIDVVLL